MTQQAIAILDSEGAKPILELRTKLRNLFTALEKQTVWVITGISGGEKKSVLLRHMQILEEFADSIYTAELEGETQHLINPSERTYLLASVGVLQNTLQEPSPIPLAGVFNSQAEAIGLAPTLQKFSAVLNGKVIEPPVRRQKNSGATIGSIFRDPAGQPTGKLSSILAGTETARPPKDKILGGRYRNAVKEEGSLIGVIHSKPWERE